MPERRPPTARVVARFMRTVVKSGTGVGAQIPGVAVAGKTGTAELRSTVNEDPVPLEPGATPTPQPEEDKTDTDAWFVGFAPYRHPRVAVAVLLVGQGAGGETAAPAAKTVIQAAVSSPARSTSRSSARKSSCRSISRRMTWRLEMLTPNACNWVTRRSTVTWPR